MRPNPAFRYIDPMSKKPPIPTTRRSLLKIGALATTALVTPAIVQAAAPYKRTLRMHNLNSGERLTITYWADGEYQSATFSAINWFMRDLRNHQTIQMSTDLLDLMWDIDQLTPSNAPLYTMSGYRSPETNAKLAARSEGVAENSFHMQGMAMDLTQNFNNPGELFYVAKALGRGGAGFYPTRRPFVHIDVGPPATWVYPEPGRGDDPTS
ncbi:MAG: Twin-arginine translocation pathway signal [Rhodobiaceae bacterium]|nr:MAG: Twin-arginine translocation pathway signal [Rhodobiaceae bacterium]